MEECLRKHMLYEDSEEENELVQRTILWAAEIVRQQEQEEEQSERGEWTFLENFHEDEDTDPVNTDATEETDTDTATVTELTEQHSTLYVDAIQVLYFAIWIALLLVYHR